MLDFTRKACLNDEEFTCFEQELTEVLLKAYNREDTEQLMQRIYDNSVHINEFWWISLHKIGFSFPAANSLVRSLHAKEICSGNVEYENYLRHYMSVWGAYINKNDINHDRIYEGALFHNPVIDLVGSYALSDKEILSFYKNLLSILKATPIQIEYLLPYSTKSVILNAATERTSSSPLWIDSLIKWSEECPYGQKHKLKGIDGVVSLCEEMIRIHRLVCDAFQIPVTMIRRG